MSLVHRLSSFVSRPSHFLIISFAARIAFAR